MGIDKYSSAQLAAAILETCTFGIASPKPGDNFDWAGMGADDADEGESEAPQILVNTKPGTVVETAIPMDLQTYAPTRPTSSFAPYMESETNALSASMGLASFELRSDYAKGVNYSSGRLGNLQAAETYALLRRVLVERLHTPVFRKWLVQQRAAGTLPGFADEDYEALMESTFVGPAPKYVDPVKDAMSVQRRIKTGVLSWEEAVLETGRDPQDVLASIKRSKAQFMDNDLAEVWKAMFEKDDEPQGGETEDAEPKAKDDAE